MSEKDMDRIAAQLRERKKDQSRGQIDDLARETFMAARAMARLGVPSDNTAETVCLALQNGCSAREMRQLQRKFQSQAKHQASEKLSFQYAKAIRQGARAGSLGESPRTVSGPSTGMGPRGGGGGAGSSGGSGASDGSGGSGGGSGRK